MGDSHDDVHNLGHIQPIGNYHRVGIALFFLTIITVVVAKTPALDFGNWNIAIAMLIASVKATLVALFFMHLKYENPITWMYAIFPLFLLGVLMGGVFIDNPTRWMP